MVLVWSPSHSVPLVKTRTSFGFENGIEIGFGFGFGFGKSSLNAGNMGGVASKRRRRLLFMLKAAADINNINDAPTTTNGDDSDFNHVNVQAVEQPNTNTNTNSNSNTNTSDDDDLSNVISKNPLHKFQHIIAPLPLPLVVKKHSTSNLFVGVGVGLCIVSLISVILYIKNKSKHSHPGSVADLVRRGQLPYDRRGISKPVKYEDPFNNPMIKVGKGKSTIEMCGKVYRLAQVNLTEEQRTVHQKRRSRAYQWKRPTIFLKEGDAVPSDVDPDTIRWIPANHPFATTVSDIDENLAQNNVYQKHGVPFRIQAEHDALQKKLEALQNDEKLNNLVIDPRYAKDFERPFKSPSKPQESADSSLSDNQGYNSSSAKLDDIPTSSGSNSPSEEMPKQPPII